MGFADIEQTRKTLKKDLDEPSQGKDCASPINQNLENVMSKEKQVITEPQWIVPLGRKKTNPVSFPRQ